MSDEQQVNSSVGAACYIITFLIILSVLMFFMHKKQKQLPIDLNKYNILVETPAGIISVSQEEMADELEWVAKDINLHGAAAADSAAFQESLTHVMRSISKFLNVNTITRAYSNEEILFDTKMSEIEINNAIMHSSGVLNGNLLNEPLRDIDGDNDSEQSNFIFNEDFSAAEKLNVVSNNIATVIQMLRAGQKQTGKINLRVLYGLQNKLRANTGCSKDVCKCNCLAGMCLKPTRKNIPDTLKLRKLFDSHEFINYDVGKQIQTTTDQVLPDGNRVSTANLNSLNPSINSKENTVPYRDPPDPRADLDLTDLRILNNSKVFEMENATEGFKTLPQGFKTLPQGFKTSVNVKMPLTGEAMRDDIRRDAYKKNSYQVSTPQTNYLQFSDDDVNSVMIGKQKKVEQKDRVTVDNFLDNELNDTFSAFLRANPEGQLHKDDITPRDFLGYRVTGSFQRSLYDYTDSYTQKLNRCLKDSHRDIEDKTTFERCMGWY